MFIRWGSASSNCSENSRYFSLYCLSIQWWKVSSCWKWVIWSPGLCGNISVVRGKSHTLWIPGRLGASSRDSQKVWTGHWQISWQDQHNILGNQEQSSGSVEEGPGLWKRFQKEALKNSWKTSWLNLICTFCRSQWCRRIHPHSVCFGGSHSSASSNHAGLLFTRHRQDTAISCFSSQQFSRYDTSWTYTEPNWSVHNSLIPFENVGRAHCCTKTCELLKEQNTKVWAFVAPIWKTKQNLNNLFNRRHSSAVLAIILGNGSDFPGRSTVRCESTQGGRTEATFHHCGGSSSTVSSSRNYCCVDWTSCAQLCWLCNLWRSTDIFVPGMNRFFWSKIPFLPTDSNFCWPCWNKMGSLSGTVQK